MCPGEFRQRRRGEIYAIIYSYSPNMVAMSVPLPDVQSRKNAQIGLEEECRILVVGFVLDCKGTGRISL